MPHLKIVAPPSDDRQTRRERASDLSPGDRLLAEALLAAGLLSRHDLSIAAELAEREMLGLVDAVVAGGLVSEQDSYATLSRATGVPLLDLTTQDVSLLAIKLVPARIARQHFVLPLSETNRKLVYAVARPFDDHAERDLSFTSGRQPSAVLARRSQLGDFIDRYYPAEKSVDRLVARLRRELPAAAALANGTAAGNASAIVELGDRIIADAVAARASDIHLEPAPSGLSVRFRISGLLELHLLLPPEAARPLTNRLKVLAQVDISVRQRPQDGAFRIMVDGRPIDIRLSTIPTVSGEKVVLRLIDSQAEAHALDALGHDPEIVTRLRQVLARPDGLVLATGPTGSGKTSLLYAALHHLTTGYTNIISVEDPVERRIGGVNQIAVNNRNGTTFSSVLRSVLRQDPNVIMVGEIRDAEVAGIVGQAAYTGHLVLSSLHTSDSASAITRLFNLGLEPFRIAESLAAIVAQRLVRRLCPVCRVALAPDEARALGEAHGLASVPFVAGPGCETCRQTGYVGRRPVAEMLVPDDAMRDAIAKGATATEIRAAMHATGSHNMRYAGLQLVLSGETTIDELNRVLADDGRTIAPGASHARRRILVADDDKMIRMLVKLLLEREGYEVLEAENGRHAVEVVRQYQPDLMLCDLVMPEADGFTAIAQTRLQPAGATLPILVLTAEQGPGVEQRVLEVGADDYLVKPFDPDILLARVRAAFRRAERKAA